MNTRHVLITMLVVIALLLGFAAGIEIALPH